MTGLAFQVLDGTCYQVGEVDAALAEYVGCPTATHRLEGRLATTYGYFMATGRVPGAAVRVPAWSTRKGVRAVFVPAVLDSGTEVLDGHLGV